MREKRVVSCEWLERTINTAARRHAFCWSPLRRLITAVLLSIVGSALPTQCQDKDPAAVQANREIGTSFSPSYITYNEYSDGAGYWIASTA